MRIHIALVFSLALLAGAARNGAADADGPDRDVVRERLLELRDGFEAPGRTVEAAAARLGSASAALAFVRDQVAFLPYRGSWHDPEATLRLRVANAADKAALLHALLAAQGREARIVRAPWPAAAKPHQAPRHARPTAALAALRALVGPPAPAALDETTLVSLRSEVHEAQRMLRAALDAAGMASRLEGVPEEEGTAPGPEHWAWVQLREPDGTWSELDPTLPDQPRPAEGTSLWKPAPAQAVVRVLLGERELVQWKGPAARLFLHDAHLLFVPQGADPLVADAPDQVVDWIPRLQVGGELEVGKVFRPGGNADGVVLPRLDDVEESVSAPGLRLEVRFESAGHAASHGRDLMRFDEGFDAQQLVGIHRLGASMGFVPYEVVAARLIDEVLDLDDLRGGADLATWKGGRGARGMATRTARVVNSLAFLRPAVLDEPAVLAWRGGPIVFVESVALAGREGPLEAIARLDVWHEAFGPAPGASRAARAAHGLATLAVEGYLMGAPSLLARVGTDPAKLRVHQGGEGSGTWAADEVAAAVLAQGGVALAHASADAVLCLAPDGSLRGALRTRGATAKGAESRSQVAGRGFAALGGAALQALGAAPGMLVGGIAGYLDGLASAYGGAARVLDSLADTIESGDEKHVLVAIGKYRGDFARELTRVLAEGAMRGWAESAIGAGLGQVLPGAGSAVADGVRDGAVAGGLAFPKDLPEISSAITWLLDHPPR